MKPYVTIFSTMTVDGKIASKTGYSRLSCIHDLKRLHSLRAENDAVMVGANTIINDNPLLTVRYVKGRNPIRIVVDSKLRTPSDSRVYHQPPRTILITSNKMEKPALEKYKGIKVIGVKELGGSTLSMSEALRALWREGIHKILVEGGGYLNWTLLSQNLVNEVRVTISPYIFGGNRVCFVSGSGLNGDKNRIKLKLVKIEECACGNEVHLVYKIID